MQKLISELKRLYLFDDQDYDDERIAQHLRGEQTSFVELSNNAGYTRALLIEFRKAPNERHWTLLCEVANALQADLGLPAPAVSVSGGDSYGLWLSLETPLPTEQVKQFKALLHQAYFAEQAIDLDASVAALPPCLNKSTGLWAAFINPGMGASFAEDLGLEMSPPIAAQSAFLEGLRGITSDEFAQAINKLAPKPVASPQPSPTVAVTSTVPAGLLLKDATLEDIIQLLHERNIEPSFRHLLPK